MGHGSFSNGNTSITERLVDLRNATVSGIAQGTNQSNHIQTELPMG